MALSATIVWEVRTGGSDTNGGGFKTGASGTDWTLQNTAQYAVTDGVTAGTTTITSATANFGTDVVGNVMYVQGGTGAVTAGWYEITARTNSTTITVDRSTGLTAGTGVTLNIGGALATPGLAAKQANVAGHNIWVKAGTYTITTSTAGSAGPVALLANDCKMEGYTTTRGDRAGRPVVSAGAITSVNLFTGSGSAISAFVHMEADGNSKTGVSGFVLTNARWAAFDCIARNCDQSGAIGFNVRGIAIHNTAISCTTGFAISDDGSTTLGRCGRCWADACATGFTISTRALVADCVASDCTGDGFSLTGVGATVMGCTADGNGGDGFDLSSTLYYAYGCLATNNTGYGFNTANNNLLEFCASYNNTLGRTHTGPYYDLDKITLSGDPYVNAASDDYRPNNTAGAGASIRAVASTGVYGQTDSRDIGAVQHTDPSAVTAATRLVGGVLAR